MMNPENNEKKNILNVTCLIDLGQEMHDASYYDQYWLY